MAKPPERFLWAIELLHIKPGDNVLEIGCGAGLLAELIAGKLLNGQYTGVDKSTVMLQKAHHRNRKFIEAGISKFIASDYSGCDLPANHYDAIIAFNVNFFWKETNTELQLIRQSLKNEGNLFIFHQAPYEINSTAAEPIRQHLLANSFEIIDNKLKKLLPTSAICVVAKKHN